MSRRGENIYKRKDGRWEGRYVKGRKSDGKIKYGYIYGYSYLEVKEKLYTYKFKYKKFCSENGYSTTNFYTWGEEWLVCIKKSVKHSTYSSYKYKLDRYIYPIIGHKQLNELTSSNIQNIVLEWDSFGLSRSSIQIIFRILNQCLNEACIQKKINNNPCKTVSIPKIEKNKVKALSVAEQQRIEKVIIDINNPNIGLAILLSLYAGLRIGEISALRWQDIDFDKKLLHVKHTYQRVGNVHPKQKTSLVNSTTKTISSERVVPLTKNLYEILLLKKQESYSRYILNINNKPCEPRLITYHFHNVRKKALLPDIHFHQLRHTFATRCLERSGDISSVSALMGHSSTQMTLDIYGDSLMEQRYKIISQLDAII